MHHATNGPNYDRAQEQEQQKISEMRATSSSFPSSRLHSETWSSRAGLHLQQPWKT
jgi:hypothetical protein